MPFFSRYVDLFRDKRVIEFGCNAGVYGYEISRVAKSYTGVDQGDYYIAQAWATRKHLKMKNSTFFATTARNFLKKHYDGNSNALFCCYALYHLSQKELNLISSKLLPTCDMVIIITRTKKRTPWRNYNKARLYKLANVERYLGRSGFSCKSKLHKSRKFGITVGRKSVDSARQGEGNKAGEDKGSERSDTQGIE